MPNRIAIAIRVWLAVVLCAGAAAIAGFIVFAVGTGFANPNDALSYMTMAVLPFFAAAGAVELTAKYVSRESNGAFHAGPMVIGAMAGSAVGAAVGVAIGEMLAVITAGVVGPILGAVLGSRVKLAVPSIAVGLLSAVVGLLFVYTATHP